jgi:hypothetical protein
MSLSLHCSCGADFEVEDIFAGQAVACPECQASLRAPPLVRGPLRTSGHAIASLVLALVGAFTVVGTLAAVCFGILALGNIRRHRDELSGAGLAVLGIVVGAGFTALTVFACVKGELFGVEEQVRGRMLAGKVDYPAAPEIVDQRDGFRITRPSEKWGVAREELLADLGEEEAALLLVNSSRDAYVSVTVVDLHGLRLDQYQQTLIDHYRNRVEGGLRGNARGGETVTDFKLHANQRLPNRDDMEVGEVLFEGRLAGQPFMALAQIFRRDRTDRAYVVRGWTHRRRFGQNQGELRKVLDSFRILDRRR